MDFTKEQIEEILSNDELKGTFLETISSTEAGQSYLNNYASSYFDKNVGAKIGEVYGNIDKDLIELGFEKPNGVKTYEHVKATINSLKEKAKTGDPELLNTLKAQNEELQSKIANNEEAKYFKEMYEGAKKTYTGEIETYKSKLEELQSNQTKSFISNELNAVVNSFKFNESLPKSVLDSYVKNELNNLVANAKISEEGTTTYYDSNGDIIMNRKTMQKATASEILAEKLKDVVEKERRIEGGGADGKGSGKVSIGDYSSAKNQVELNAMITTNLLSDGYVKGSTEYNEKFSELLKANRGELPLR